jgi:CBS domain-containing protein
MSSVRDILRTKGSQVHTIDRWATVYAAIDSMTQQNVGALVVVEGDHVCGIVTERDYLRKIALQGRSSRTTTVDEILSSPVVCVRPEDTVADCLATMTQERCRHLPVQGDEGLAGVVSIGDCVKQLVREQRTEIRHLQDFIQGRYG